MVKSNGYKYQADSNKAGEINYRKGVAEAEEKNPERFMGLMKLRMEETLDIFKGFDQKYRIGINNDRGFGEFGEGVRVGPEQVIPAEVANCDRVASGWS